VCRAGYTLGFAMHFCSYKLLFVVIFQLSLCLSIAVFDFLRYMFCYPLHQHSNSADIIALIAW